jgi:hypothetical protein
MMTTTTMTRTLAKTVQEATAAEDAARKAAAAAEGARRKADAAKAAADEERARAYQTYLDKLVAEHPAARDQATTAVGEARAALERAVRGDDGVFRAYFDWVSASVQAWEVDSELSQIRDHHGVPVRSTDAPVFRFDVDIAQIVDGIAAGFQDDALQRIVDRRVSYVNGRTA